MKKIFEEGAAAFKAGTSYEDNPHPIGSREFVLWMEGWLKAEMESKPSSTHTKGVR